MFEFKLEFKLVQQLMNVNCCTFFNKQAELENLLKLHNVDLLCVTEFHLNDSILNSEVFPDDYWAYRRQEFIWW